ncbi:hypothetical protein TWF281_004547 [Arthrobotrys megalospora]
MTQITTFPYETLLQIFGEIDIADIYNLKRTCRRFNAISEHSSHVCVFKVDAPGHPTWKLLKYLLRNQDIGKQIIEIRVEWHRRIAGENANDCIGTEQWTWTDREIKAISHIGRGGKIFLTDYCEAAILGGINSEALLPLLLVLTPRLESLDLGVVNGQLISHNTEDYLVQKDALETLLNLFNDEYRSRHCIPRDLAEWSRQTGISGLSKKWGNPLRFAVSATNIGIHAKPSIEHYSSSHIPPEENTKLGSIWLQYNIVYTNPQLPLRDSLKHFRCTTTNHSYITDASHYLILTSPRIETVFIDGCFSAQGPVASRWRWDCYYNEAKSALVSKSPGLRRIELLRAYIRAEDLELLAKMTVNLEYIAIQKVSRYPEYEVPELPLEDIGQLFLENNEKLSMDAIVIVDYTGKRWGNGSFGGV